MSSQFPAYDPATSHGDDGPVVPQPAPTERRSYPTVADLLSADPVEVAAVLLRAVWEPGWAFRLEVGRDQLMTTTRRLVADRALLAPRYGDDLLRITARSLNLWTSAGVVGLLPTSHPAEGCVVLEPEMAAAPLDVVMARLDPGRAR